MKKLLIFVFLVAANSRIAAQTEISRKSVSDDGVRWTISPAQSIKKGIGRLNLDFPDGAYWSLDIYKGNKFITNRSIETYKLKHHDLAPGLYNLKLNVVLIENVEIKEGHATTLETGVLDINSNDWELRS